MAERRKTPYPHFQVPPRMRSIPASVFGPVLSPLWSLHRPFAMAGHWQDVPRLFFAPQRRTRDRSPGGLPFLSHPRRGSWGTPSIFSMLPTIANPQPLPSPDRGISTVQEQSDGGVGRPPLYCSFAYSALASFRIGMSRSESFQTLKKS
jgi:hypothetical protein